MDENGYGPDENDKLFDELDKLVALAKESEGALRGFDFKYSASLVMINLMMEEVGPEDIRIYQQIGDSWVAEVKYHGIIFVYIAGKHKPETWAEFDNS